MRRVRGLFAAFAAVILPMVAPAHALQMPSTTGKGYYDFCQDGYCLNTVRMLYCTKTELQAFPNLASTTSAKPYKRPGSVWYYFFKAGLGPGGQVELPPSCSEVYNVSQDPNNMGVDPTPDIQKKHPGAVSVDWFYGLDVGIGSPGCPEPVTRSIKIFYTPDSALPPDQPKTPVTSTPSTTSSVKDPAFAGIATGRMSDGRANGGATTRSTGFASSAGMSFCNRDGRSKATVANCLKAIGN